MNNFNTMCMFCDKKLSDNPYISVLESCDNVGWCSKECYDRYQFEKSIEVRNVPPGPCAWCGGEDTTAVKITGKGRFVPVCDLSCAKLLTLYAALSRPRPSPPPRLLLYLAGPYSAPTREERADNTVRIEGIAREILSWRLETVYPITPHSMGLAVDSVSRREDALAGTLALLRRCDALIVAPGWETSEGTKGEIREAEARGMPIYRWRTPEGFHPGSVECEYEMFTGFLRHHFPHLAHRKPEEVQS